MQFSQLTMPKETTVHMLGSMKIFELKKGPHTQREWKLQVYSIHKIVTEFFPKKEKLCGSDPGLGVGLYNVTSA